MKIKFGLTVWSLCMVSLLSAGTLHYPANSGRAIKDAASDIKKYVQLVTGKKWKDIDLTVYLGESAAKASWYTPQKGAFEEWFIVSKGNELVITGDLRGTVWGAYEFIEKYLGVDFLTQDCENIPSNPAWKLPEINERNRPAIPSRVLYTSSPGVWSSDFARKRKFSSTGIDGLTMYGGAPKSNHAIDGYILARPELPRAAGNRANICPTNPKSAEIISEQMLKYIAQDRKKYSKTNWPLVYDLGQPDGGSGNCLCKLCKQVMEEEGGNYSGVMLRFVNKVAEVVGREYPDIVISTLAYQYTQQPPAKVKAADNVMVVSCNSSIPAPLIPDTPNEQILNKWGEHASKLGIWSYWRIYTGEDTPYVKPRAVIKQEFQYCRKVGVWRYFSESEGQQNRSFTELQNYLWSKMSCDPDGDVMAHSRRFMQGFYGAAADAMTEYLDYLEKRQAARPFTRTVYSMDFFLDEEFFRTAQSILAKAEAAVANDPVRKLRVAKEKNIVVAALLRRQDKFAHTDWFKNKDAMIAEWKKNSADWASQKYLRWHKRSPLKSYLAGLETTTDLFKRMPFPIPEQFKGKKIYDMHWPDFNPWGGWRKRCVDDPEATSGKAFALLKGVDKPGKPYHRIPITYGVYDSKAEGNKFSFTGKFDESNMPQDEKYHWYYIGKQVLKPNNRIYFHWSWNMEVYFRKAVTGIVQDNPRDVWVSLKITGPAYVKNSTRPNGIYVERVIIVEE